MVSPNASAILPDAMLQRFRERAPGYDRENRFFQEDFDELRQAGYLAIAVPRDLGGRGLSFAECMREQRRLARGATSRGSSARTPRFPSTRGVR